MEAVLEPACAAVEMKTRAVVQRLTGCRLKSRPAFSHVRVLVVLTRQQNLRPSEAFLHDPHGSDTDPTFFTK